MDDSYEQPFLNKKHKNNPYSEDIRGVQSNRCYICGNLSMYRCLGGPATVKGCNKFYCSEHDAPDLSNLCS